MNFKGLWTKLFTRNDETDDISLHVSGVTVRHRNPFEDTEVQRNDEDLTDEMVNKWVVPFYMTDLSDVDNVTIKNFAEAATEINVEVVQKLLGDFNWRTRIAGAYFAAINNYKELEDVVGEHLLKSEVCYAGAGYCLALATFGGDKSKSYLSKYLEYYLDRKDLWFDQADALCALAYLDKLQANKLTDKWKRFVVDKQYLDLERSKKYFYNCMLILDKIRQAKRAA